MFSFPRVVGRRIPIQSIVWICVGLVASSTPMLGAAPASVEFEIVLEGGLAPTAAQDWLELFKGLDQSGLRIRSAGGEDKPGIEKRVIGKKTTYQVMGVVRSNNMLILPGGTFRFQDKAKLRQWIEKLKEGGDESVGEKPGAFGLFAKQLVEINEKLAVKVTVKTKGTASREVISHIERGLRTQLVIDPSAQEGLRDPTPVADEFQGLSAGTVLAATLRPLGLVFVPEKPKGGELRIRITDARDVAQSWPIGWPLTRPSTESVPKLMEFLAVEIENTPLAEALPAIQERLDVPFLLDYNALARLNVDLDTTRVSLPSKRTYYSKLLDRVLAKANLTWEVRKDELDQSFIWISSKK